jgi:hypothetical protein
MTEYEKIARWLLSGDTGASSKSIVAHALKMPKADSCYPIDVYDFGRCYRMLRACPGVKIEVMRHAGPCWNRLPSLEMAYEMGLPKEDYHGFYPHLHAVIDLPR